MTQTSPASPSDFGGVVGDTYHESEPWWPPEAQSVGRPNVLVVLLDDMGFGSLGCYGSEIATPTIDALARDGAKFTNFHATALCSPTRASLLTGRNSHAVGMAYLSHVDDGFPGYRGRIGHDAATLAEMLVDQGYNTMAVGKWHLTPMDQTTAAGPYDQWPLARGFERFYGFHEGLTDHYFPELFADNHPVPQPASPDDGYHLTTDLVDQARQMLRDQVSVAPEKPFFMYFALGATHTPFHAPAEFVERYHGVYDEGWDAIRQRRFERQRQMGVVPEGTELPPPNDDVPPWDELPPEGKRAMARFQEVYAGFLEHTDHEIGRLLAALRELGKMDDTIVVLLSDNGASQEGGQYGVMNTTHYENGHFPPLAEVIERQDEIDGRKSHINYPLGWAQAGNTPLRRYKQNTHAGGIRTPLIVRLPQSASISAPRGRRDHFQHVTDVVPTILDLVGVAAPTVRRGAAQLPLDGQSMRPTLENPDSVGHERTQYFETVGNRAIWKDGWKAVALHRRGGDFADDRWELYHVDEDFSECHDLAETEPEKLRELVEAWWGEARQNKVLPLHDLGFAQRTNARFRPHSPRDRSTFVYYADVGHIGNAAAPPVAGRSFEITATIGRPQGTEEGVLIAHGSWNSGYCLLVEDDRLTYDFNYYGRHFLLRSDRTLAAGKSRVAMRFVKDPDSTAGTASLTIDGERAGEMRLPETFEFFVSFQGLDVGADRLSPVRAEGVGGIGEFAFNGELDTVRVEILDAAATSTYQPLD